MSWALYIEDLTKASFVNFVSQNDSPKAIQIKQQAMLNISAASVILATVRRSLAHSMLKGHKGRPLRMDMVNIG